MRIKCLLVIPGKEVQKVRIPSSNKFIKSFIGEELIKNKLNDDVMIISSKNANRDEFNRMFKGNILFGTFLIVSIKNNHKVSMKKKDIRKYTNMFKLRKHQRKIELYKEEYLEEYYTNQRKIKQEQNMAEALKQAA